MNKWNEEKRMLSAEIESLKTFHFSHLSNLEAAEEEEEK